MIDYSSLPTRNDMISKAVKDCLTCMYKVSYPSSDKIDDYTKHYIPEHIYDMILDSFLDAYRISPEVNDTFDIFKQFVKEPYHIPTKKEYESGLFIANDKPMNEECFDNMSKYIEMFLETHKWNGDEQKFKITVSNYAPSSNREAVEKEIQKTDPSFTIPDDSYWDEDIDESNEWFGYDESENE